MADETVKLILELENKAKKDFNNLNKEIKELKKNSNNADREVGNLDKEFKNASKSSKEFSTNLKGIGSSLKGIGTGAVAAVAGIGAIAFQASQAIRELQSMADIAGLNVEEFSNLSKAYESFGVTAEGLSSVLKDITERIDDAVFNNAGEFIDVAKQLNIELDSLNAKSAGEQLEFVIEKLNELDPNRARSIADRLGGDELIKIEASYRRLGNEADNLVDRVKELDLNFTEEEVKNINKIRTEFDLLTKNITLLLQQRAINLFAGSEEGLAKLNNDITDLRKGDGVIKDFADNTKNQIGSAFSNIGQTLKQVGIEAQATFEEIKAGINKIKGDEKAVEKYTSAIKDLQEQYDKAESIKILNNILSDNSKILNENIAGLTNLSKETKTVIRNRLNAIDVIKDENSSLQDQRESYEFLIDSYQGNIKAQKALAIGYTSLNNESSAYIEISKEATEATKETTESIKQQEKVLKNVNFSDIISNEFGDSLKNAQLELLRLEGNFRQAFDIEIKPTTDKIELLKAKIEEANELISQGLADDQTVKDTELYTKQLEFLEKRIALEKELKLEQENDFDLGQYNEEGDETNQLFNLGLINEEEFIEKMDIIGGKIKEVFGEDSVEFQSFIQNLQKVKDELDVFGQISQKVFEDFSAGFGSAVADSLVSGASLRDGLGQVFASIVKQMIQAVVQALIFAAIMSSLGIGPASVTGGSQSFGEIFKGSLGGSFGVKTFHNGGSLDGSADPRNSIKRVNIADPSSSLSPDERFIIAKTDESIVQTSSLNSPTGVGNNQPTQPEVKINNYITDDVLNAFLTSDAAEDTIVNIVNRNSDRTR